MKRAALAFLCCASPAQAEVMGAGPNGFELRHDLQVSANPRTVWTRLGQVGTWWNPAHSYGGEAEGLRMTLQAGGCFCETIAGGGSVEHMRVSFVDPGRSLVLTGGLGPLLREGVAAALEIEFVPAGSGTRVIAAYRAAGFARNNAAQLAPAVDRVLGEQWTRLKAVSEARRLP